MIVHCFFLPCWEILCLQKSGRSQHNTLYPRHQNVYVGQKDKKDLLRFVFELERKRQSGFMVKVTLSVSGIKKGGDRHL
ncbi:unnamed protein product [Urochloa humidicola]